MVYSPSHISTLSWLGEKRIFSCKHGLELLGLDDGGFWGRILMIDLSKKRGWLLPNGCYM